MLSAATNPVETIPNIRGLRPVGAEDQECLDEIRHVLAKHGALQRFGVTLLHEHFAMSGDEILKEYCDEDNRTMVLTPTKRSDLDAEKVLFTAWDLGTGEPLVGCIIPWEDGA
jgi:hypothetical protein